MRTFYQYSIVKPLLKSDEHSIISKGNQYTVRLTNQNILWELLTFLDNSVLIITNQARSSILKPYVYLYFLLKKNFSIAHSCGKLFLFLL